MNYLDDIYNMPIKAVSIDKRKWSKNETHEIFVSQSSDFHFSISDSVNNGEFVTSIDIPPDKLEIIRDYIDKAIANYKNKKRWTLKAISTNDS